MIIYGERLSRAERVLWAADECGIDYTHVPVPTTGDKDPALLAINPDGAIPTIDDDGVVVSQSWAINLYLARKYGGDLASQTVEEEADILRWTFWAACDVEGAIMETILCSGLIPAYPADPDRVAKNAVKLQRPMKSLNTTLANRDYVAGNRFTMGDLNAVSIVSWLPATGFDFTGFEFVRAWIDRCKARPHFPKRGI